jgi:hypothetical protein
VLMRAFIKMMKKKKMLGSQPLLAADTNFD